MLSTSDLRPVIGNNSGYENPNKVESIELQAIQSLQTSVDHKDPRLARELRPEIETLSKSGLVSVRNKALELLQSEGLDGPGLPARASD